jgi:glycosyltransferase involved in cell wall biosynthesis
MNKKIAVCIPTYNSLSTLMNLLDSLLSCNLSLVSVFVFDDCSADQTCNYINSFRGFEIKLVPSDKNVGFVGNINRCLKLADDFDWICIIHHDDVLNGEVFNFVLDQLSYYPSVGIVFSGSQSKKVDDGLHCRLYSIGAESLTKARSSQLAPSGVFYNSMAINKCGFYNLEFPYSADEEYHARIAKDFSLLEVSGQIARMMIHGRNYRFVTWEKADFLDNYIIMRRLMLSYSKRIVSSLDIKREKLAVCYAICVELLTYNKMPLFSRYYRAGISAIALNILTLRFFFLGFFRFTPIIFVYLRRCNSRLKQVI